MLPLDEDEAEQSVKTGPCKMVRSMKLLAQISTISNEWDETLERRKLWSRTNNRKDGTWEVDTFGNGRTRRI